VFGTVIMSDLLICAVHACAGLYVHDLAQEG